MANKQQDNRRVKRAGPYLLGATVGKSPTSTITNVVARLDGTNTFRIIKILHETDESLDVKDGKVMLLTEHSILEYLTRLEVPGVVREYGLFRDEAIDEGGEKITRYCLVLDCYMSHDFSPEYTHITNLHIMAEVRRFH